jgi:TPR repeat protein
MNQTFRGVLSAMLVFGAVGSHVEAWADDVEDGRAAINAGQYEKARRLLLPKAKEGNAVAQNALGVLYRNGWGVKTDYSEALEWFRRAAAQGNLWAQVNVGQMYGQGQGVDRDFGEEAKWYRGAAEQGFPPAQSLLGAMYARGDGVSQNWGEAMRWYRKAADQGDALAQSRVGLMHAEGQGTPKDYAAAEIWFRKAAAQQHPAGQTWLGLLYLNGWGVKKDVMEAMKWLRLAADQEEPDAQYTLGAIFAEGKDATGDDVQAVMWLRRAAMYGHGEAQQLLQQRFSVKPEQGPLLVRPDQAMRAPSEALASAYVAASSIAEMLELARAGRSPRVTLTITLDGKAEAIGASNALLYLAGYQDRLRVYGLAITRRGSHTIAGTYRAEGGAACGRIQSMWAGGVHEGVLREMNISQDSFKADLVHKVELSGKTDSLEILGVVVESVLAFVDPANSEFLFIGRITPGQITVRPDARVLAGWPNWANPPSKKDLSECVVTLRRVEG